MERFRRCGVFITLAMLVVIHASPSTRQEDLSGELVELLGQENQAFLFSQIEKIGASSVMRQLKGFEQSESTVTRDICSRPHHPFTRGESLSESTGEVTALEVAVTLVRQGPAEFITRAAKVQSVCGRDLLTEETLSAIRELARHG